MIKRLCTGLALLGVALSMSSCLSLRPRNVARSAAEIRPLLIGAAIPEATVRRTDGTEVNIQDLVRDKHTVLIVYRGGWCPYCMRHLQDLAVIEPELKKLGYQIYAISPDSPAKLRTFMVEKQPATLLLSDSQLFLGRALGIVFEVDKQTVRLYDGYGIDLHEWSNQDHNWLPVPAVFIVGPDGTIGFSYVNPTYQARLSGDVILAAAQAVRQGQKINLK